MLDSVVPYAVATEAQVAPGQLLIVFEQPLPPGGIQIGVYFQIVLQLRKVFALKIAVAESPNFVPMVMQVSLSSAGYLVTQSPPAAFDEPVVVEVCVLVEVLVVPDETQIITGVHSQMSSQLSHEGFEALIESTVIPYVVASLAQVSPVFAVYVLHEVPPVLVDVEVWTLVGVLVVVDVEVWTLVDVLVVVPDGTQTVTGVHSQISLQLSQDGLDATIEATVTP